MAKAQQQAQPKLTKAQQRAQARLERKQANAKNRPANGASQGEYKAFSGALKAAWQDSKIGEKLVVEVKNNPYSDMNKGRLVQILQGAVAGAAEINLIKGAIKDVRFDNAIAQMADLALETPLLDNIRAEIKDIEDANPHADVSNLEFKLRDIKRLPTEPRPQGNRRAVLDNALKALELLPGKPKAIKIYDSNVGSLPDTNGLTSDFWSNAHKALTDEGGAYDQQALADIAQASNFSPSRLKKILARAATNGIEQANLKPAEKSLISDLKSAIESRTLAGMEI